MLQISNWVRKACLILSFITRHLPNLYYKLKSNKFKFNFSRSLERKRAILCFKRDMSSKLLQNYFQLYKMPQQNLPRSILVQSEWKINYFTFFLIFNYSPIYLLNFHKRFEANFGQQTVVFAFKCGSALTEMNHPGQGQQTRVCRKGNRMEVIL